MVVCFSVVTTAKNITQPKSGRKEVLYVINKFCKE